MSSILKYLREKSFTVETLERMKSYAEKNNLILRNIKLAPSKYRCLQADWKARNGTELPDLNSQDDLVIVSGLTISIERFTPEDYEKFAESIPAMDCHEYFGPNNGIYLELTRATEEPESDDADPDDWLVTPD